MGATVAMVPVDFDAFDLHVSGCVRCGSAWWAEVVLRDRMVLVREWHRESCPEWGEQAEGPGDVEAAPLTDGAVVVHGPGLSGLTVVAAPRAGVDVGPRAVVASDERAS